MPERRKSSRNAELSSLFTFCITKVSTVTGIGGVVVAKPRTVVTFGLVSRLRVSKVSTVTGIGGGRGRETQNCRHFWTRLASLRLKSVNSHRDRGGRGRETQNCRHFWTRLASPCLKSVNSHRDRGVVLAKPRTVVILVSPRVFAFQKCQQSQGSEGSWSRNAELSSLLDSSRVFASRKCQQSQGSGGSCS